MPTAADIVAMPGLDDATEAYIQIVLTDVINAEDAQAWGECWDRAVRYKTAALVLDTLMPDAAGALKRVRRHKGDNSEVEFEFHNAKTDKTGWMANKYGQLYENLIYECGVGGVTCYSGSCACST